MGDWCLNLLEQAAPVAAAAAAAVLKPDHDGCLAAL